MNRTQTIKHSNLKRNNKISWPIRTRKTQIIEYLNHEKCEISRVETKKITIGIKKISLTRFSTTLREKSKYGVFPGRFFPVFGLNMEIYSVNLRIQTEYRKIWTRENSVFGHFSCSASSISAGFGWPNSTKFTLIFIYLGGKFHVMFLKSGLEVKRKCLRR